MFGKKDANGLRIELNPYKKSNPILQVLALNCEHKELNNSSSRFYVAILKMWNPTYTKTISGQSSIDLD